MELILIHLMDMDTESLPYIEVSPKNNSSVFDNIYFDDLYVKLKIMLPSNSKPYNQNLILVMG